MALCNLSTFVYSDLLLNVLFFLKEIIFGGCYDSEGYNPFYMTRKDPNYGKVNKFLTCIYLFLEVLGLGETWSFWKFCSYSGFIFKSPPNISLEF